LATFSSEPLKTFGSDEIQLRDGGMKFKKRRRAQKTNLRRFWIYDLK
jgi:hypothetical protein